MKFNQIPLGTISRIKFWKFIPNIGIDKFRKISKKTLNNPNKSFFIFALYIIGKGSIRKNKATLEDAKTINVPTKIIKSNVNILVPFYIWSTGG